MESLQSSLAALANIKVQIPPQRRIEVDKADEAKKIKPRRSVLKAVQNLIPSQEQIDRLIQEALSAMKEGFFWDRGSIVNLVV